jgi:hypothetical protein
VDACGIIITAYKQKDLVEQNIIRIRKRYRLLDTLPIIVVSTSEENIGFEELQNSYDDIHFLEFPNAPGSSNCNWWKSRPNPSGYLNWRHQFLPPRILLSMQKGIQYAYDIGLKKILHLHSDTYFKEENEVNLIKFFNMLDQCMMICDTSSEDEGAAQEVKILPKMLHIHPEGLFLNLEKCKSIGYGFEFFKIFDPNSGFISHNYGSLEALIGQFCIWCLSHKNILKYEDEIPKEYFENVYFVCNRSYYEATQYGLVNIRGQQPDGK